MSDEHTEEHDCAFCRRREEAELSRLKAMQNLWVQRCTMTAECLNRLRVIPRILVAGYGVLVWQVVDWFMNLPTPDTQQAALVTTVVGASGLVFGFYMQGGTTNKKG